MNKEIDRKQYNTPSPDLSGDGVKIKNFSNHTQNTLILYVPFCFQLLRKNENKATKSIISVLHFVPRNIGRKIFNIS